MAALGFLLCFLFTSTCLALQTCCAAGSLDPLPSANLSTVWISRAPDQSDYEKATYPSVLLPLASPDYRGLSFGAGFCCLSPCSTFVFGVYAMASSADQSSTSNAHLYVAGGHQVLIVWSANYDRQVRQNATLNFTGDGDLVLRDADGSLVWSSNTSGRSVVGMKITEAGNLVLHDQDNVTVWQSFDYPVDALLPGQRLLAGKSLTPVMSTNLATSHHQFYVTLRPDGVYAFAGYREPRLYYRSTVSETNGLQYMTLMNGSLVAFTVSRDKGYQIEIFGASRSLQCVRLELDGHLKLYEWNSYQWVVVQDIMKLDQCNYPSVCGDYGICSGGQCTCPTTASSTSGTYFKQLDGQKPNLGCGLNTPISCQPIEDHQLVAVSNVSYFNYIDQNAGLLTDEESCKKVCLGNCSCQAALFRYDIDPSNGSCLLVSEVLSLVGSSSGSAFLKVQITHPPRLAKKRVVLPSAIGGGIAGLVVIATAFAIMRWRQNKEESDEDEFLQLPGMPKRFTFQSLQEATKNFSSKIGEGGFGSVFKGELGDELVAVKHLHRAAQGAKEFLAEVQTIGSLHHINLVRLIGFCTGYMAPEWLTSQITEKVDVYSFGVVVMEIICGRRNLDYSQPECSIQLISLLQEKAKNNELDDMIDRNSEDMHIHKEEVIGMMNLAIWCLQSDSNRRPAMSLVVKVLEGERQVEPNLQYNFFDLSASIAVPVGGTNLSTLPIASVLSVPR